MTEAQRRFFIIGGYSCGNPGDEAILKATLRRIRELYPDAFFTVWLEDNDYEPALGNEIPHEIVRWDPFGWMFNRGFLSKVLIKLYTDLFPYSWKVLSRLFPPKSEVARSLERSEKVLFIGGGYLNSYHLLIKMHALAKIAQARSKPLLLLGQTLGPFIKKQHVWMSRDIFRAARKIVLRDAFSGREVAWLRRKVLHSVDDAIGFKPQVTEADRRWADHYLGEKEDFALQVGLNLLRTQGSRRFYRRVAEALAAFALSLPRIRVKALFIPMEASRYCDDRLEGAEFARELKAPVNLDYAIVQHPLTVEAKYELIGRLDLFIGMRLHSLAFSLSGAVPTIGLYDNEYYYRKICGLFQAFDLDAYTLHLERAGEELQPLLREMFQNKEFYRKKISATKRNILVRQDTILKTVLEAGA